MKYKSYPRHKHSTNYMYKHIVTKNKKYNSINFSERKYIFYKFNIYMYYLKHERNCFIQ